MDESQCRTCLSEAQDQRLSIDRRVNGILIIEMLEKLTQISVTKDDMFSNLLCKKCFNEICAAYLFRKKALDTERTLRGFEKKLLKMQNIKQEVVEIRRTEEVSKMEVVEEQLPDDEEEQEEEETIVESQDKSPLPIIVKSHDSDEENLIAYEIQDHEDDDVNVQFIEYEYEQVEYLEVDAGNEEHEEISYKTESDKVGKVKYICALCTNAQFKTVFGINRHLYFEHRVGSSPFLCESCNVEFPIDRYENEEVANYNIQAHIVAHTEGKTHPCTHCFAVFKTLKQLEIHQQSNHQKSGAVPFKCKGCHMNFSSSYDLNLHIASSPCKEVQDKSFRCYICNQIFSMGIAKKKHIQEEHQDKAGQDCPRCLRCKIPSAVAYENHYKTHFVAPRFSCNFCERSFYESDRLQMHIRRNHDTSSRYTCFFCSKKFRDKSGIARHILGVHFNDRKYKCGQCLKAFTTSYNLKEHMFSIHKQATTVYTCESCSQEYLYRKQFERHRKQCAGFPEKRKR